MKDELGNYCKSVGMGEAFTQQVLDLLGQCETLAPAQRVKDYFIGEYVTEEGSREYDILYFFASSIIFEIEKFVSQPNIWIARQGPAYLEIAKKDFNFTAAKDTSRLSVRVIWAARSFEFRMRASGENCEQLTTVVQKYIVPMVMGD